MRGVKLVYTAPSRLWLLLAAMFVITSVRAESNEDDSSAAAAGRVIYDQRQSGKYNIHVSIKDVAIIEMDQNELEDDTYSDDNYYYDDDDLTVKPIKFPTPSTLATSDTSTSTTTTTTAPATTTTIAITNNTTTGTVPPTTLRWVATTTIGLPANVNYSANLLADLAATQAAANEAAIHAITNTTATDDYPTTTIMSPPTLTQTTTANATDTNRPALPVPMLLKEVHARTKDIPIREFNEPASYRHGLPPPPGENSRIFKVNVQRNHRQNLMRLSNGERPLTSLTADRLSSAPVPVASVRCRAHQYRDAHGNCRGKRSSAASSSSFLRKLFSMLVSLPFASERGHQMQLRHHVTSAQQHHHQQH